MNNLMMSPISRCVLREIDSRGIGPAIPIPDLSGYEDNDIACKYQCGRALVIPGQIYVHEVENIVGQEDGGFQWIVNAVTRKNWDDGASDKLLIESLAWVCKWAKRRSIRNMHYVRPKDEKSISAADMDGVFGQVKSMDRSWGVVLISSDAWDSSSDVIRRRGFARLRGE